MNFQKNRKAFIGVGGLVILGVFGLIIFFTLKTAKSTDGFKCNVCYKDKISPLGEECSESLIGTYKSYAISTDSNVCAPAGQSVIEEGGNAVDAAIAVHLCMGVTIPESLGLGGGSLITIYNATTKRSVFINAREMAPATAHRDMFNQSLPNGVPKPGNWSEYGIEAIAVPGELAGHWEIFTKFGSGKITWERLFKDAIKFATDGFPIGRHLQNALKQNRERVMWLKTLRDVYLNPKTNDLYKAGEILVQPKLAETLKTLSKSADPRKTFYVDIAAMILKDLRSEEIQSSFPNQTLFLSETDFKNYAVSQHENYKFPLKFDNQTFELHTSHLPGSGILLQFILRVMARYPDLYPEGYTDETEAELFYHRLMEAFKFAFANRQYLGDDQFDKPEDILKRLISDAYIDEVVKKIIDERTFNATDEEHYDKSSQQKFDHGTAHLSVLDKEGNAVAITATVNMYFGSKIISPSTGLILNDQMDDFNTGLTNGFGIPESFANTIVGGKRPLSSMVPSVFTDDSGVRLVIGASGGPKIITAVSYVTLRHLYFGENIKQAIDAARPHHQLFKDEVVYESCIPDKIIESLKKRNHTTTSLPPGERGAIVMGISRSRDGKIQANSDFRKGGTIAGA